MASVDETIERSIRNYPSLFANRTQVLHHLFAVIGNGYDWVGGELVDVYDSPEQTDESVLYQVPENVLRIPEDASASLRASLEQVREEVAASYAEKNAELLERRRNAAVLARTPGPLNGSVYPECEYAYLRQPLPADVRPDWAAARSEIAAVVEPRWAAGEPYASERAAKDAAAPVPALDPQATALLQRLWNQAP